MSKTIIDRSMFNVEGYEPIPPLEIESYNELLREADLDCIRGHQEEIAFLLSMKETAEDDDIFHRCRDLINLHMDRIDKLRGEL